MDLTGDSSVTVLHICIHDSYMCVCIDFTLAFCY